MRRPLLQDPAISTVTLALNYACNSRCTFCFIEPEIAAGLPPMNDAMIDSVFAENRRTQRYKRLILAGAEATLRKDLAEIAARAIDEGGFEVVRLQTNGRRLGDRVYLEKLIRAGIGEFFVSCHAGSPGLDAALTRAPRAFTELLAGLRAVRDSGARLITNTAVVNKNYSQLPRLADFFIAEELPESHFWAFIEFGDVGQAAEHVAFSVCIPPLLEAVRRLRAADRAVTLSWFPECLLGDYSDLQKNHRDDTLIHDRFSDRVRASGRFDCPHAGSCPRLGASCYGLHERHVAVIGDERAALRPLAVR